MAIGVGQAAANAANFALNQASGDIPVDASSVVDSFVEKYKTPESEVGESLSEPQAESQGPVGVSSPTGANVQSVAEKTMPAAKTAASSTPASSSVVARQAPVPAMHPASFTLNMQSGTLRSNPVSQPSATTAAEELASNELSSSSLTQGVSRPQARLKIDNDEQVYGSKTSLDSETSLDSDTATFELRQKSAPFRQQVRNELVREGIVERPDPPKSLSHGNRTFGAIKKLIKQKVSNVIKHAKSYTGQAFYETIFSKPELMPHCVSLGIDNMIESLREPNSGLLDLINEKMLEADPSAQPLTTEECLASPHLLYIVNQLNIEVVLEKTPVNINHSAQVRTLRVHFGRGIGLHPTQTKAYNADYDGDPAFLILDQAQLVKYARAMDRLIASDGTPLIDPDFFPLEHISDADEAREIMRGKGYFSWAPFVLDEMIDAYIDACNNGNWVGLLRRIDEVADKLAGEENDEHRNEFSSAILMSLYDFSIDYRGLMIKRRVLGTNEEHSNFNPPERGTDPFVVSLVNLTDEIVAGRPCPSLIEFTRFYNKYYGEAFGSDGLSKNVPFRLLADFAKAIHRTDLITVGSDLFGFKLDSTKHLVEDKNSTVTIHDLWQFTCAAGLSKAISGRMHMGSRSLAVSTQVRSMVMKDCPIVKVKDGAVVHAWSNDEEFRDWIDEFKKVYNLNNRMLHLAEVSFRGGMFGIVRNSDYEFDGIGDNYEGLADALVRVYGQKTVGYMFPALVRKDNSTKDNTGATFARFYRNMSIDKFVTNNRFVFRDVVEKDEHGNEVRTHRSDYIEARLANGEFTQMDVLMLIADRRTSQLGDYGKKWIAATEGQFEEIGAIPKYVGQDYNDYVEEVMETIQLMSPDMFYHFGMDSPTTFMHSTWGKKLLGAKTVDEYRTHLFSMMVQYRIGKIAEMSKEYNDAESAMYDGFYSKINVMEELDAAFESELEVLGSSSIVWHAIVSEMTNGSHWFHLLMNNGGVYGNWSIMYGKESFWSRPAEEKDKYYSLLTFLKSSEPLEVKIAVLADVTRVCENYAGITKEEILGQVASHPDRLHAGNRFDMDKGISNDIAAVKESIERISSYRSKTPEKIRSEADKLLSRWKKDKAGFERHLRRLAGEPGYAVHVDTMFAADAIASIFEKDYNDSEKIKQQAFVNGYFGCVSYQRSGGFYTHLYMADNAVVNMVGFDQVTAQEIVLVLSDPSIELTVYDEFGTPAPLSRQYLCGGNTIDDVLKYLDENPRIALQCRRFMAGIAADANGTARENAFNDESYDNTDVYRVFSLLNDRPRFLALAALVTGSDNNVGRNMSERVNESIKNLCSLVIYEAQQGKQMPEFLADIEDILGISESSIMAFKKKGSFDETEITHIDNEAVGLLYREVVDELSSCVSLVRKSIPHTGTIQRPAKFGTMDQSSIIAYYDARQQISGARTATMITIEGAETKKNLVLKEFLRGLPDEYTMSEDGKTVIPFVDGLEQASDRSLVHDQAHRTSSIAKFLEIKRENGAETYNAKYKKYGDDGTNSMIKFIRMAKRAVFDMFGKTKDTKAKDGTWSIEDASDLLEKIRGCKQKFEAVEILANALVDADVRLGYIKMKNGEIQDDSFVLSDYWNRASLMIGENSDGTFVVRTLEQLSAACRSRLSDEAVISGDPKRVHDELAQIVYTVGTDMDPMLQKNPDDVLHECLYGISLHSSVGNIHRIDRALRSRSSSVERNYTLLYHICEDLKERMHISELPSNKQLADMSADKMEELDAWLKKQLENLVYVDRTMKADKTYKYDYLGKYDDSDRVIVPGPQSIVLFDTRNGIADQAKFARALRECYDYGMTALIVGGEAAEYLSIDGGGIDNDELVGNLVHMSRDIAMLPFFDMRLNGMFSKAIVEAPAEIPVNPNNFVVNDEDTTGEFREGDSTYHITKELADRIRVMFRGQVHLPASRLFPNTLALFGNQDYEIDFCTNEEVQKYIINADFNPETLTMDGFSKAVVDLGIAPGTPRFERERQRFATRLQEYKNNFTSADADSIITGDCGYDSIIGFVKIKNLVDGATVLAPVWPFHLEESGKVPTRYAVDQFSLDHSEGAFILDWVYTGGLEDQYIKAFEGIGASTKLIAGPDRAKSRTLENGIAIDGFYSTNSVASRLILSNKRIHTMISAMMMPRMDPAYAYNFGDLDGAFPGNDAIRDAMRAGSIGLSDWKKMQDDGVVYHIDPQINRIVKWWVDKCLAFGTVNPTTLLATKVDSGFLWPKITEFEAFLDTGYRFQDAWMKLMHSMCPTLMPESITANADGCLFVPVADDSESADYGVLQMRVPHYLAWDSDPTYVLENVYISMGFFGEEYSGFKKVNINAFNRSIDDLNVANRLTGDDLIQLLTFGRSGMSSVRPAIALEAEPDNAMHEIKPSDIIVEDSK